MERLFFQQRIEMRWVYGKTEMWNWCFRKEEHQQKRLLLSFVELCSCTLNKQRWLHEALCWVWPGERSAARDRVVAVRVGADSVDLCFQTTSQVKLFYCFPSRPAGNNSSCFIPWHNSDHIFSLRCSQFFSCLVGFSTRYFINVIVLSYIFRPQFLGGLPPRAVTFCNCSAHLFPNTSVWNYLFFPVRRL